LIYPELVKEDTTSQSNYGLSVFERRDSSIKSFSGAKAYASYILANRKDPLETLEIVLKGHENLKVSQVVTINYPTQNIPSSDWRIVDLKFSFKKRKVFRTELKLVGRYARADRKILTAEEFLSLAL